MTIRERLRRLVTSNDGQERLFTALVLSAAVLCTAWPLLSAVWLPFVDFPQHLGTVAAIHGQSDPIWSSYFDVQFSRVQYLAFYWLADLLAYPFGVELGTRLTLVLGLSTLPLAVAALLRAYGRPPLLGALSAAISLHIYVFWGFLNYSVAIGVALFALAAMARLINAPNWKNAARYSALTVLCFYCHAQVYGWMALASVVQVLAAAPQWGWKRAWRATWHAAIAAIPSIVGMLYWLLHSRLVEEGMAGLRGTAANVVADKGIEFETVANTLRSWLSHSFGFYRDGGGENIAVFMMAVAVLLIAMRGLQPRPDEGDSKTSFAPELLFAFALACYLFLPKSYKLIAPINHRFLPLALALIPALGPTHLASWKSRIAVGGAIIALCIYVGGVHSRQFDATDVEMGDLSEALSHTQPGKRLLGLVYDTGSAVVPLPTYLHAHQYYQVQIGGYAAFGFIEFPISPLVYQAGAAPPPFAIRFEWTPRKHPQRFRMYEHYFDYYLLRVRPKQRAPRFYPSGVAIPQLLYDGSRWKLYKRAHD